MLNLLNCGTQLLTKAMTNIPSTIMLQQTRNTFVLKRRYDPLLHRIGAAPRKLRKKHMVYDFVENRDIRKKEDIQLVLLDYVEGIGLKGDVVSVPPRVGRNQLLLPKLAVYATPENISKYQRSADSSDADKRKIEHSSLYAEKTAKHLSLSVIPILMNMDQPWTLEKWHIRASLRKTGVFAPDQAIEIPEKPISGPNLELEGKIFLVTVTINNCEKSIVRCEIHHWTSDQSRRIPTIPEYWGVLKEPLFQEDLEILTSLPPPPLPKSMRQPTVQRY